MKVDEPAAPSRILTWRAAPSPTATTSPRSGCEVGEATRTSPSGSVSLAMTGSEAERPGRTPKESSTASGGVLFSERSAWVSSAFLVVSSSSVSSFSRSELIWSQLSTWTMSSSGSHRPPSSGLLRTMALRLMRNTALEAESRAGKSSLTSREASAQSMR